MSQNIQEISETSTHQNANHLVNQSAVSEGNEAYRMLPEEMIAVLDKHVIGQEEAKRAVVLAVINRWRRKRIAEDIRDEIMPSNIMMIGPTGVGKTAIANCMGRMSMNGKRNVRIASPFLKVEATKFTEIGYVGRDVDSIIRDLLDATIVNMRKELHVTYKAIAIKNTENRILSILVGDNASAETKEEYINRLRNGDFENSVIEFSVVDWRSTGSGGHTFDIPGAQIGMLNIGEMIQKSMGGKKKRNIKSTIAEARDEIFEDELESLLDKNNDSIIKEAIQKVQEEGIVLIDEIDKIASRSSVAGGNRGDVSKEGVQRDLLPLIEGTIVSTKYGQVSTHHILFIAAGAFHIAKPSDLLPELQGRFPVRVQLKALDHSDILRILTEKQYNLPEQYKALLAVEGLELDFTHEALERLTELTILMNNTVENIGARRLYTIFERLMEDISFNAHKMEKNFTIDLKYVNERLAEFIEDEDMAKYIL